MLTLSFFGAIFSSALWLIYSIRFVLSSLSGMSFFDAGITNVLLYVLFVCLPVLLLWTVFGFINQYINNRNTGRQMHRLFAQMKKNQEYSDLLARIMLETEQNIKNSFVLSRFDLFVADMNELLSEFILRERLVSSEQNEYLWVKVQNGGKWAFGKVLIENYNQQPSFQKKIFNDALADHILSGTVLEFCARYQTLIAILEKHDKEKVFLNIIETGVFGKVFAILAPVSDEIKRARDVWGSKEVDTQPFRDEPEQPHEPQIKQSSYKETLPSSEGKINQIFSKFMPTKKEKSDLSKEPVKDAFSLALERSFSETPAPSKEEPVFDVRLEENFSQSETPTLTEEVLISKSFSQVSETDQTLDNLKKEWKDFGVTSEPQADTQDLTYPFGGWTDAGNYQK